MNKELENLIRSSYSVVVWDIDGTLTEARWDINNIIKLDETKEELMIRHYYGNDVGLKPLKCMQEIVNDLKSEQYVLSNTHGTLEDNNKNIMLDKYFPIIEHKNRYYTRNIEEKKTILSMLARLIRSKGKKIIYVSDSLEELIELNIYFNINKLNSDTLYFYHTSSLFV